MPSELDRKYDAVLAAVTGEGGRFAIEPRRRRAAPIVANLPGTLPILFDIFCTLNGAIEAVVAGDERLTFADLHRHAQQLAKALVGAGIQKGDRVGIAMRNCPAWIVSYMAILEAGGIATLLNGWWQADEMRHALELVEPKLVIADAGRAKRLEEGCGGCRVVVAADRAAACRGAGAAARRAGGNAAAGRAGRRRDDPVHLGLDRARQGRRLDPPRRHHRRLRLYDQPGRAARHPRRRRRDGPRAEDPGQRAAVPRHRRGAGAAEQLRHRPDDGADAQMGCGRGAAADRAGEDHLFRRGADDEPGADAASRPRQI